LFINNVRYGDVVRGTGAEGAATDLAEVTGKFKNVDSSVI